MKFTYNVEICDAEWEVDLECYIQPVDHSVGIFHSYLDDFDVLEVRCVTENYDLVVADEQFKTDWKSMLTTDHWERIEVKAFDKLLEAKMDAEGDCYDKN